MIRRLPITLLAFSALGPMGTGCDLFSANECARDADCKGGDVCARAECVECESDSDCSGAKVCDDNECTLDGEGEGEEGEGEASEGEGEGEGEVAEGEGEVPSEGEGEGETSSTALHIELTWSNANDLDLYATRGPPYCVAPASEAPGNTLELGPLSERCQGAPDSCGSGACSSDWDRDFTVGSAGDPDFAIDDTNGFGPEAIDVVSLADGAYLVGAYVYQGTLATAATLRVTYGSQPAVVVQANLGLSPDWADLAVVHVSGGVACIASVTDGDDECD